MIGKGGTVTGWALAALLAALAPPAIAAEPPLPLAVNLGGPAIFPMTGNSLASRRFGTVVRQQLDFSCGSAALATLLRFHYAEDQDERSTFLGMWEQGDQVQIRKLGFSLLDMKRFLARAGLQADGYRVTLDQIAATNSPGIALIDFRGYHHFVVVKKVERDAVLLGDPSLGLRWEKRSTFMRQWNGVFFAIGRKLPLVWEDANRRDIALAPRFDLNSAASPVSAAVLRLVRPVQASY